MTLTEISALIQSGVLSGLAILLVYRIPHIWTAVLDFIEKSREYNATMRSVERSHTEEMARKMAAGLQELSHAIIELRAATTNICKFREPPRESFVGEKPPTRHSGGPGT